jgi:hypothetical protein
MVAHIAAASTPEKRQFGGMRRNSGDFDPFRTVFGWPRAVNDVRIDADG